MSKTTAAFRTIGEVAQWLDLPAHVLRFWESKFFQIRPVKGAGGRRYYRPEDMALLSGIKVLLHEQGLTIRGAQKLLREQGVKYVMSLGSLPEGLDAAPTALPRKPSALLSAITAPPQISLARVATLIDHNKVAANPQQLRNTLARLEALRARLAAAQ